MRTRHTLHQVLIFSSNLLLTTIVPIFLRNFFARLLFVRVLLKLGTPGNFIHYRIENACLIVEIQGLASELWKAYVLHGHTCGLFDSVRLDKLMAIAFTMTLFLAWGVQAQIVTLLLTHEVIKGERVSLVRLSIVRG